MPFGSAGEIRFGISIDDQQAINKLQSVGQQFTTLGNSTEQATQQIEQVSPALDEVKRASDNASTSTKSFGTVMKQNVLAIGNIASGIIGLVSQYTSLQKAQNSLARAENIEIGMKNRIQNLTLKLAAATREYGANSREVALIQRDLNLLQEKYAVQIEKVDIMQQSLNERMADFGLNILPTIIQTGSGIVQVAQGFKNAKPAVEGATVAVRGFGISAKAALIGTGIGAILVTLGTLLVAFTQNWWGTRDAVYAAGKAIGDFIPLLRPVLQGLQAFGEIITNLLGGEMPQTAEAAVAAMDDVGTSISDSGKAAAETQKEIDDLWNTLGEAPNLSSALDVKVDKDKLTKKLFDYLPDKMSKEIELFLETKQSVSVIRDSFEETIAAASELNYSDAKIDRIVDQTIKLIGEKFPDSPQGELMQKQLSELVAGPHTLEQVKALIQSWNIKADPTITLGTKNITFGSGSAENEANNIDEMFVTDAGKKIKDANNWFQKLIKAAEEAFSPTNLSKIRDQLVQGIFALPSNLSSIARTFIDPFLAEMIRNITVSGPTLIAEWAGKTFTWDNLKSGIDTVVDIASGFNTWFWGQLSEPKDMTEGLKTFATNALNGIGEWFVKSFPESSKQILEVGKLIGGGIQLGLQQLTDFGKTSMDWIGGQITSFLSNPPDYILKAGRQIVDGLIQGIQGMADIAKRIWDAITSSGTVEGPIEFQLDDGTKFIAPPNPQIVPNPNGGTPTYKPQSLIIEPETIQIADIPGPKDSISPLGSDAELLRMSVPSITVTPKKINIAFGQTGTPNSAENEQGFAAGIGVTAAAFKVSVPSVDVVPQKVNIDFTEKIKTAYNDMAQQISKINLAIAKSWSKVMNQNISNTKSGVSGVVSRMNGMASSLSKIFLAIAKSWSKTMNSMISNAKSGANGVINQLNRIPKKIVTVHETQHVDVFGKGGIIKAAGGLVTSNGPKHIMIGDNPGGRETFVAIPHNDPDKWVDLINSMFPQSANGGPVSLGGGGTGGRGVNIDIHNHFLEREVMQKFRYENGRLRTRMGPA